VWPGPDLRPLARGKPGIFSYGILPHDLYRHVRTLAAQLLQARRAAVVTRGEE
jgi:hypothetical protein